MTAAQSEWARCRPWIEAGLKYDGGFQTIEAVEAAIEAGEAQFWPGQRAALVTEILHSQSGPVIRVWLAGGDLSELVTVHRPALERWAVEQGCNRAIIIGRAGWLKALRAHGFRPLWTAVEKDLVTWQ